MKPKSLSFFSCKRATGKQKEKQLRRTLAGNQKVAAHEKIDLAEILCIGKTAMEKTTGLFIFV